ncbi:hypothetical protein KIN20_015072 [Parelaphostrongylus tenuis]|uniref:Uncharacterized protein n=1 Tax=Parelaphostrongylus tenuis TaxID=148309 RepID=A0AAD5N082_PARTN|nr:hypothetical protein KIN20_015072 [Parelaphostrongylus tenuis]
MWAGSGGAGCGFHAAINRSRKGVIHIDSAIAGTLVCTSGNPYLRDEDCVAFSPAYCKSGLSFNAESSSTTATTTSEELIRIELARTKTWQKVREI